MAKSGDENETALSLALKRAKDEKRAKRTLKVEQRLAKLRTKRPNPVSERKAKVPKAAPITDAALQVSSQHYLQDKRAKEERARRLARIALGREPLKPAAERSPPPPPSGPDDPRVQNGTFAPSPRVAERLKNLLPSESETPVTERPLQTSPFPPGWQQILETGTTREILAGRKLADLKGSDREAYYRARHRRLLAVLHKPRRRKSKHSTPLWDAVNELRFVQGWTVETLAEKAGISATALREIFRAGRGPDERLRAIAGAFGLTLDEFRTMIADEPTATATAVPEAASVAEAPALPPAAPEPKVHPNDHPRQGDAAFERLTSPRDTDRPLQAGLRAIMRERHLTGSAVARLCGFNPDIPSALLRGAKREASFRTVQKLCAGLNVTEDELFNRKPPQEERMPLQDVAAEAVALGFNAARDTHPEAPPVPPVGPKVKIEKGVPLPPITLLAEMYRWDELEKGDSILAETPFGMTWADFKTRFHRMANRYSEQLGHWYTTEEDDEKKQIRLWRII